MGTIKDQASQCGRCDSWKLVKKYHSSSYSMGPPPDCESYEQGRGETDHHLLGFGGWQ